MQASKAPRDKTVGGLVIIGGGGVSSVGAPLHTLSSPPSTSFLGDRQVQGNCVRLRSTAVAITMPARVFDGPRAHITSANHDA